MVLIVPLEITLHIKLYFKTASGKWLSVGVQLDSGNVVNEFV